MAFDITGMEDYVKGNSKILIMDTILAGDSFSYLSVQDGIKTSEKMIDFSDAGTVIQGGDYSATSANGGVKMLDKAISVKELHVKENYKRKDLEGKIAQLAEKAGSDPSDLTFKDAILGLKAKAIQLANEKLLWGGDTDSATPSLAHFDGYHKIVSSAADSVKTGVAGVQLTADNAIAKVEEIVEVAMDAFPEWIDVTTQLAMSPKNFMTYFRAVNKLNSAVDKVTNESGVVKQFTIPGTNVKATSYSGMHGNNDLIIFRPENFTIACDLKGEEDKIEFEYFSESFNHRLFALYKLGAGVARTSEVVITGVVAAG